MMKRPAIWAFIALLSAGCIATPSWSDEGLVLHYRFDAGSGTRVADLSGNDNDATVRGAGWLASKGPGALVFDGVDDYAECASSPSLDLSDAVTLEAWIRPDRATVPPCEAGIVGKGVAHFGAYGLTYLRDRVYVYVSTTTNNCAVSVPMKTWSHVVGTFDGKTLAIYLDGRLADSRRSLADGIGRTGEALFVGRNRYKGMNFFPGAIGEVRIYDRALAEEEVCEHYIANGLAFGRDVSDFRRIVVKPHVYRMDDLITADIDVRGFRPLPEGAFLHVGIGPPKRKLYVGETVSPLPDSGLVEFSFDTTKWGGGAFPAGQYEMSVQLNLPSGTIGRQKAIFAWPAAPAWRTAEPAVKPLNNLVMELLNVRDEDGIEETSFAFTNPYEGWVFFQRTADPDGDGSVEIALESGVSIATREAMRFLPEGRHELTVRTRKGKLRRLVVRSIPQIMWCKLYPAPYMPHVRAYGPYDWAFFERTGVLDNVNVMISRRDVPLEAPRHAGYLADWTGQGKKWIVEVGLTRDLSGEKVAESWLGEEGVRHPLVSGILIDEFGGSPAENYRAWAAGVRIAARDRRLAGKMLYPYCATLPEYEHAGDFIKAVMESGQRFAWEVYLGLKQACSEMPRWSWGGGFLSARATR